MLCFCVLMAVNKSREEWKIHGNVFDKFTLQTLNKLSSQNYFDELISAIAIGKEANVFLASKGTDFVVVKIYRLENCNFNQMFDYIAQDPRYLSLRKNKRLLVFNWVQREFRNLMLARECINVPTPIVFKNNVLVMSLVGSNGAPAVQIKNLNINDFNDVCAFKDKILDSVNKLWKHGLVHGDLSAFNILYHNDDPVFIDFSQATTTKAGIAKKLLIRDINNIHAFFKKFECDFDVNDFFNKVINS